jgi:hypothetical protein
MNNSRPLDSFAYLLPHCAIPLLRSLLPTRGPLNLPCLCQVESLILGHVVSLCTNSQHLFITPLSSLAHSVQIESQMSGYKSFAILGGLKGDSSISAGVGVPIAKALKAKGVTVFVLGREGALPHNKHV